MKAKIKEAKKEGRAVIGYKEVLKNLADVEEIILAWNCPEEIKRKLKNKAEEEIKEVELSNMEIGETLGKPFSVSCLGIK